MFLSCPTDSKRDIERDREPYVWIQFGPKWFQKILLVCLTRVLITIPTQNLCWSSLKKKKIGSRQIYIIYIYIPQLRILYLQPKAHMMENRCCAWWTPMHEFWIKAHHNVSILLFLQLCLKQFEQYLGSYRALVKLVRIMLIELWLQQIKTTN